MRASLSPDTADRPDTSAFDGSANDRLTALETRVGDLLDRQDIADCIHRAVRAIDRHDLALFETAFHPDATIRYGHEAGGVQHMIEFINAGHKSWTRSHTHNITTHTCRITGDRAQAESYVLAGLAAADGSHVRLCGARYVDELGRHADGWRIASREVVIDWVMTGDASVFGSTAFVARGFAGGRRDTGDLSYRPATGGGGR